MHMISRRPITKRHSVDVPARIMILFNILRYYK